MIIGSTIIAIVVCEQVINKEISDGISHTKPVSSVLYNHLYKLVRDFYICLILQNFIIFINYITTVKFRLFLQD